MYVIVDIAGQQMKVEQGQEVFVNRLEGEEGDKVEFGKVLLVDNDGKVKVGKPSVKGAKIDAKIVDHLRGDKVVVFKKKRRKGYKVKNGHRQYLTEIQIDSIAIKAPAKKAVVKKEADKTEKPVAKKEPAAKKAAPAKKASSDTAAKKTAAKKPAAKKTAAKKEDPKK